MKHTLKPLPYPLDALNPHISKQTMEYHYGKHHLGYVNTLNNLIAGTKFEDASLETIVAEADGPLYNNAAQIWNHTFYFEGFAPIAKKQPTGGLGTAIQRDFGSLELLIGEFNKEAAALFGSGWVWLAADSDGKLLVMKEPNAGNPLRAGLSPLLACDVWEHAYYLDYQNRRSDYLNGFWALVDWAVVERRYGALSVR